MKYITFICSCLAVVCCGCFSAGTDNVGTTRQNVNEQPAPATAMSVSPASSAQPDSAIKPPAEKQEAQTKWSYSSEEDKMTSGKMQYASIDANDLLEFKFPYDGGAVATFIIRKREGETNILLQVSQGQFMTDLNGGTVRIRFDSGKAVRYSTSMPSDYSHDVVFIDEVSAIISRVKKAKKMYVEAEFYNEGLRVMEFDVPGLEWPIKNKATAGNTAMAD